MPCSTICLANSSETFSVYSPKNKSPQWDLNPWSHPYQECALPLSYEGMAG